MKLRTRRSMVLLVGVLGVAAAAGSVAIGQPDQGASGPAAAEIQACIAAGTPGPQHEVLTGRAGVWSGRTQMWMGPDAPEPLRGECTWTLTPIFGGRYVRTELAAALPGLGEFHGLGLSGFDNVSRTFVSDWIDDHGSGIMRGTGELSADGRSLTWTFAYNCPVHKGPAVARQVETTTGDTMTFDMFVTDPASGKEYRCMHIDFTKKSS